MRPAFGRLAPLGLEPLEPRLVLVHLAELAVAPVALDELLLAGDRFGLGLDVLDRPRVALDALAVVGAVVAAERGQAPVAELPDPGHGRVEEGPVVRGDEERPGSPPEMLLEPFERVEVEVVGRLVEQQQVRVGDDQAGQRRPGLLAARQRRRRFRPLVAGEPEPGQRGLDPLVERVAAEDLVLVLELGVGGLGDAAVAFHRGQALAPSGRGARRRSGRRSRRSGEAMNASSKCASWASRPSVSPRLRWTSPRSGSSRPAASRRSVVLPAPFGPTRPIRSPSAIDASIASRITNVPTSRVTPDRRRMLIGRRTARPAVDARAAARRVAAARFVRSVRARVAAPAASSGVRPERPLPCQLGPAAAGPARPAGHRPQDRRRALPVGRTEPLAPRAEVRRARPDHDPLDRYSRTQRIGVGARFASGSTIP